MLEIIGLLLAMGAIAGFARGRGASPVLMVVLALAGYLAITFIGGSLISGPDARLPLTLCAWAWIGIVALFVRFVIGARRPGPGRNWICSNCHYTNARHALLCEACQEPWRAQV
jgi:hypothetical protein